MGSFSIWHWLIVLVFLFPLGKVLSRMGFHWAFALLSLIPIVNIVLLWVLAFVRWPRDKVQPLVNDAAVSRETGIPDGH